MSPYEQDNTMPPPPEYLLAPDAQDDYYEVLELPQGRVINALDHSYQSGPRINVKTPPAAWQSPPSETPRVTSKDLISATRKNLTFSISILGYSKIPITRQVGEVLEILTVATRRCWTISH